MLFMKTLYTRLSTDAIINKRGYELIRSMEDRALFALNSRVLGDCPAQCTYVSNIGKL